MMALKYTRVAGVLRQRLRSTPPGFRAEAPLVQAFITCTRISGQQVVAIRSSRLSTGDIRHASPCPSFTSVPVLLISHRCNHSLEPAKGRYTEHTPDHTQPGSKSDASVEIDRSKDWKDAGAIKSRAEGVDFVDVDTSKMTKWEYLRHIRVGVKQLWKRYGWVSMGTYWTLYIGALGGIYAILATGAIDASVDTSHTLQQLAVWTGADANPTLSEYVRRLQNLVETNPRAEKLLIAYVANEFVELPRLALVFFLTPSIARALGRAPPKKPKSIQ